MKFRLSEEDAERLGSPREVEFDETKLMGREAIAMKKQNGWTPERLGAAGQGERVVDADGNQVWLPGSDGEPARDEHGNRIPLHSVDAEAMLVMLWLAVRRTSGHDLAWADFDVNLALLGFPDDEVDEGKAPAKTTASTSTSTTSKRTTTATSRSSRKPSASPRGSRGTR